MHIRIATSLGDLLVKLDPEKAPISTRNFLAYADAGFYDGTVFHRVIATFMIQGGGYTADMNRKPTSPPIANEWKNGLRNTRGTLAMARLGGDPDSATSQFFVNVADNPFLDRPQPDGAAYAVLVIEGETEIEGSVMNVPARGSALGTQTGEHARALPLV